jgi:secreted trypsin-like serine protease
MNALIGQDLRAVRRTRYREDMPFSRVFIVAAVISALSGPATAIVGNSRDGDSYVDRIVMVLSRNGGREGVCTGVAIAPRVVLTAAHCLAAASDTLVGVRIHGKTEPVRIAEVARHPGYDPEAPRKRRISIDVGLVETAEPLPEGFRASDLSDDSPALGKPVTVVGFGLRSEHGPPSDGHARAADLVVGEPISKVVLWARDPGHSGLGGCHGDSGGPMFSEDNRVVAVVAWTNGENGHGCGAVTQGPRIGPVKDWIALVRSKWGQ